MNNDSNRVVNDIETKINENRLFLVLFIFSIIWCIWSFNKTAPVTEGWFTTYGTLVLDGKVPFRDFELIFAPFFVYFSAFICSIFGTGIVVWRIIGSIVFLLMIVLVYKIYRVFFTKTISVLASTISVYLMFSEGVYYGYDYIYFFYLLLFFSVYLLMRYLYNDNTSKNDKRVLFIVGLIVGILFGLRQSTWLVYLIFLIVGLFILNKYVPNSKISKKGICFFMIGTSIPIIIFSIYLMMVGAFDNFIQMMFFSGSKGGFFAMLFGCFQRLIVERYWLLPVIIITFLLIYPLIKNGNISFNFTNSFKNRDIYSIIVIVILVILAIIMLNDDFSRILIKMKFNPMDPCFVMFATLSLVFVTLLIRLIKSLKNKIDVSTEQIGLLFLTSVLFVIAFGGALSADITYRHSYVIFGLTIGLLMLATHNSGYYKIKGHNINYKRIAQIIIIILVIGIVSISCASKSLCSCSWFTVSTEAINDATNTTNIPYFEGMKLTDTEKYVYEDYVSIIETVGVEGGIYTYAATPVFYTIVNYIPDVNAPIAWFDVASDEALLKDLELVQSNHPRVMVFSDHGTSVMDYEEKLYRGGHESGQRAMYNWLCYCRDNAESGYTVVASYYIQNYPIYVLVSTV